MARQELSGLSSIETTTKKWLADFKCGRANTDDAKHPGRPNSGFVTENINKVHEVVLPDRKLKLREIAVS